MQIASYNISMRMALQCFWSHLPRESLFRSMVGNQTTFCFDSDADKSPRAVTAAMLELSSSKIALYTHLCDLLCFCVINHSFRSKFFILSSSVTVKLTALLRARPKHIRLGELHRMSAHGTGADRVYQCEQLPYDTSEHVWAAMTIFTIATWSRMV